VGGRKVSVNLFLLFRKRLGRADPEPCQTGLSDKVVRQVGCYAPPGRVACLLRCRETIGLFSLGQNLVAKTSRPMVRSPRVSPCGAPSAGQRTWLVHQDFATPRGWTPAVVARRTAARATPSRRRDSLAVAPRHEPAPPGWSPGGAPCPATPHCMALPAPRRRCCYPRATPTPRPRERRPRGLYGAAALKWPQTGLEHEPTP